MKKFLLWVGGLCLFNFVTCLLLGLTLDSPWFPLWMAWCGGSGFVVGMLASESET